MKIVPLSVAAFVALALGISAVASALGSSPTAESSAARAIPYVTTTDREPWEIVGSIQQMNGEFWTVEGFVFRVTSATRAEGEVPSIGTIVRAKGIVQPDGTWLATEILIGNAATTPDAPMPTPTQPPTATAEPTSTATPNPTDTPIPLPTRTATPKPINAAPPTPIPAPKVDPKESERQGAKAPPAEDTDRGRRAIPVKPPREIQADQAEEEVREAMERVRAKIQQMREKLEETKIRPKEAKIRPTPTSTPRSGHRGGWDREESREAD